MPLKSFAVLCLVGWFATPVPTAQGSDWPQWLGPRGDSIWRDAGIVETFPAGGPPVRWRAAIGAGYSGPVVAGGRVFLTDRPDSKLAGKQGKALDRTADPGRERVVCLNEADGSLLWRYEYECPYNISYAAGPRASPAVAGNRVYTLGAEGNLHCLDTATGRVVWARDFKKDYGAATQLWGHAASPLVDGDRLICLVGGEGHTVVAFDRETGAERWRALPAKEPGYSAPLICEAGGRRQLIVWDTEAVNGLDPETGRVYWSEPFKTKLGHAIATARKSGDLLFVSGFFDGSLMLRLDAREPKATVAWKIRGPSETKPEGLHSLMTTPFLEGGYIYGVCGYGQLRCLNLETGERVWETLAATTADNKPARWTSAFLVKHEDRFFLLNEKGDLIIARLSPAGYAEISRTHLLEPTNVAGGRGVLWSHPAYANGSIYARNDREIIAADLRAKL
ncbi:MAG: PQQ-binding-like beta-propeller repeat protein [Verrucomicrobia bacterium]|nr:PQQ-binding-like beta-propeller repeat protein [Verrucomicrobiota bacterium]